jgi:hypothetical protein
MPKPADVEPTPDDLLASAIHVIRETWARIRKGPYGKQALLQTIYEVYSGRFGSGDLRCTRADSFWDGDSSGGADVGER